MRVSYKINNKGENINMGSLIDAKQVAIMRKKEKKK